jgi:hypothetical protein
VALYGAVGGRVCPRVLATVSVRRVAGNRLLSRVRTNPLHGPTDKSPCSASSRRIEHADDATLDMFLERVLSADSLAAVFGVK